MKRDHIVEKLKETEEGFRLLVEGVRDYAIYSLDPDGFVTTWNTGAQRIKGYTAEEIIGKHFSSFYTPTDVQSNNPDRALKIAARNMAQAIDQNADRQDPQRGGAPIRKLVSEPQTKHVGREHAHQHDCRREEQQKIAY